MPDPITEDHWRAQVILHGKTGLPEDQFVNTFTFRNDSLGNDGDDVGGLINTRLATFFNDAVAQTGLTVAGFLTSQLINPDATLKVYDLGAAKPREAYESQLPLAIAAGNPLPPEVACCLSFFHDRNLPRQRGRIYLGPLAASTLEMRGSSLRFTEPVLLTLTHAMRRMSQASGPAVRWSTRSTTYGNVGLVTAGFVDDSPDTQRRRGVKASGRYTWTEADVIDEVA